MERITLFLYNDVSACLCACARACVSLCACERGHTDSVTPRNRQIVLRMAYFCVCIIMAHFCVHGLNLYVCVYVKKKNEACEKLFPFKLSRSNKSWKSKSWYGYIGVFLLTISISLRIHFALSLSAGVIRTVRLLGIFYVHLLVYIISHVPICPQTCVFAFAFVCLFACLLFARARACVCIWMLVCAFICRNKLRLIMTTLQRVCTRNICPSITFYLPQGGTE